VTPSLFDPGLEGVTVAETELSRVDEDGDLLVRGFPVAELAANASFEECCYLLLRGDLPTTDERDRFRDALADQRVIGDEVRAVLRRAAAENRSPMDALRMGLASADLQPGSVDDAPLAAARRAIAVVPTVVATYWRRRRGVESLSPRPDLSHAANYHYLLTGAVPDQPTAEGLETFLTTMAEHGLNTSTFAARVVASTGADPISAATAAVAALKGPRHGGQFARVSDLLRNAHDADAPDAVVREHLREAGTLPGFGHRVYEVRDPRAAVLAATADRLSGSAGEDAFLETARTVETVGRDELAAGADGDRPRPTVDFYAAALLHALDIPAALLPATFAVGRVAGWMAHCLEQADTDHLVRPVARYVGETERSWTPVEERTPTDATLLARHRDSGSLEPVSETLATLSEPARLEVLLALFDAEDPLAYSALKAATSIEDKGRFNYHLRQLRDYFVRDGPDGYALTDAGHTVVHTIVTDDGIVGDLPD
jgi:citrate synthase